METREIQAIKGCQVGITEDFGIIYDKYIRKIYSFIYHKTMHRQTAEDLTSQTFFKALDNINKYNIDAGSFSSWLYKIARNNVIDYYKSKKDYSDIENAWDISDNTNIEIDTNNKILLEKVQKYLQTLKPRQQEIIIMRIWDQLSYQEISEITGQSKNSLKMAFSRAINKLRQDMPLDLLIVFLLSNKLYE